MKIDVCLKMTKLLKVRFVLPRRYSSEDECEPEMHLAFEHCSQYKMTATWVTESECMSLKKLTKKDIFVFQSFDGSAFVRLSKMQCLVVGARCLSYCLVEGEQIPPGPPIFTTAMRNLVIVISGFSKSEKEAIKEKVLWMGGTFYPSLVDNATHLISNTVLSEKYTKAIEVSISVMQERWVTAVWDSSLKQNVSGNSPQFNKYKLPPFANLVVTSSGLSKDERLKIEKLVNKNGGTYKGQFESNSTNILILPKEAVGRDKYRTAMQYDKICVLPAWVYASVEKGYCDNFKLYRVSTATTSSPISSSRIPNMTLDFSTISNVRNMPGTINETVSCDMSVACNKGKENNKASLPSRDSIEDYEKLVDGINMDDVKKAGAFLDGVCAYICGWSPAHRERLASVVSRCGGMRYEPPTDQVTHIICGHPSSSMALVKQALEVAQAAVPVHIRWLVSSLEARKPLDAAPYRLEQMQGSMSTSSRNTVNATPLQPSPTVKKSAQMLIGERPTVSSLRVDEQMPDEEDDVMLQYINEANKVGESEDTLMLELQHGANLDALPKPDNTGSANLTTLIQTKSNQDNATNAEQSTISEASEDIVEIFNDIRFELQGIEDEVGNEYKTSITSLGGLIVKAGHGGSYVVVPLDYDDNNFVNEYTEVVTTLWVDDCVIKKELLPIQYFHRPVRILHYSTPLKGLVLGISTYTGVERSFIDEVATLLGAVTQQTFCRRTTNSVIRSTHLICPEPNGAKYNASVRWGLPAISVEWLLACAAAGKRVKEAAYLIGDTKEPEWEEDTGVNSSPNTSNKENEEGTVSEEPQPKESTPKMAAPPPPKECTPKMPTPVQKSITPKSETPLHKAVLNASLHGTPMRKNPLKLSVVGDGELSPASRYIAMARQGLLGADTQETPVKSVENKEIDSDARNSVVKTPATPDSFSTPDLSKFTPNTKKGLLAIKRGEIPTEPIKTPKDPFNISVDTPESPFGAVMRPGVNRLSPESRKQFWKDINDLPGKLPDFQKKETPLNELMERFLNRYNTGDGEKVGSRKLEFDDDTESPAQKYRKISDEKDPSNLSPGVNTQLRQLTSVLMGASGVGCNAGGSANATPQRRLATNSKSAMLQCVDNLEDNAEKATCNTQLDTVGWDDLAGSEPLRRFMISTNVDQRDEIIAMIEKLGGEISLNADMDLSATHLLCSKPGRSEKVLGSIAARKWVIHPSYVVRSHENGKFIEEKEYEWGNPEAKTLPSLSDSEQQLAAAVHRWRSSSTPPYASFKIVLHMSDSRRGQLCRLIEAGGGTVIADSSPYSCTEATHCFVEKRNKPISKEDLKFFALHNIPVCLPVFLNNYLVQETPPNASQCYAPEYKTILANL